MRRYFCNDPRGIHAFTEHPAGDWVAAADAQHRIAQLEVAAPDSDPDLDDTLRGLIRDRRELRAKVARVVALAQPVIDEHDHRTEDTSLVLSEFADKILEAVQ